jgi:hypothetical protein
LDTRAEIVLSRGIRRSKKVSPRPLNHALPPPATGRQLRPTEGRGGLGDHSPDGRRRRGHPDQRGRTPGFGPSGSVDLRSSSSSPAVADRSVGESAAFTRLRRAGHLARGTCAVVQNECGWVCARTRRPARPSSARPVRRLQEAQHLGREQVGGGVHCGVSLPRHDRDAAVRQSPLQRLAGRLERFAAVAALEV